MSKREMLLKLINDYSPNDSDQNAVKSVFTSFVEDNSDCFLRSNLSGHITGSCWLISPDDSEILLTHHKKIGDWFQLGGHADGDPDILAVALREAMEESGIAGILPVYDQIFDLDIHLIPKHFDVPTHFHYDVRFALRAPHKNFTVSDESHALAWRSIKSLAENHDTNLSLRRMAKKWLKE